MIVSVLMPRVFFTPNLQRHISFPPSCVDGDTVGAVLGILFSENPRLRNYILDDQGRLRKHVLVFIDGELIRDRTSLSDPVPEDAEIFVTHALSGG